MYSYELWKTEAIIAEQTYIITDLYYSGSMLLRTYVIADLC